MLKDCQEKRAAFIDHSVKIRETFRFSHPIEKITAVKMHCSDFYGNCLWDLRSSEAESIFSAWKTCLKLCWDVPRACHTYFLHNLLAPELPSIRPSLLSRFHGFFLSLLENDSHECQVMARLAARDLRTNFGSNLRLLSEVTGLDPWSVSKQQMKAKLQQEDTVLTPPEDTWRVAYLEKLLCARQWAYYNNNTEDEIYINNLIDDLVKN